MWLTGKLAPGLKIIADVRRDHGTAIQAACRQVIVLCRRIGLITGGTVAVDGSRFRAVNTRDKNFTPAAGTAPLSYTHTVEPEAVSTQPRWTADGLLSIAPMTGADVGR